MLHFLFLLCVFFFPEKNKGITVKDPCAGETPASCHHTVKSYFKAPKKTKPAGHTHKKKGIWMEPTVFATACILRLGLQVRDYAAPCTRCVALREQRTATAPAATDPLRDRDLFGHHTLCCMTGNDRNDVHHSVCKRIFADASHGLLHPRREEAVFGDSDRMDIVFTTGARTQLLDIAITCPFRGPGSNALAKAAASPGGWATAYEDVKQRKYAHKCSPLQDLVPVVFDTFGAAGLSARPVLHRIATAFSRRLGAREGRLIFFTRLSTLIVSKAAAIVRNEG